jgi:hypothetical protein
MLKKMKKVKKDNIKKKESVWYELFVIIVGTLLIMFFKTCV